MSEETDRWVWLSGPGVPQGQTGMAVMFAMPVFPSEGPGGGELRHLDFADPPTGMTGERYEEMIRGHARETGSRERFTESLLQGLGSELVQAHRCEPAVAEKGIREFAERIWAEEHP